MRFNITSHRLFSVSVAAFLSLLVLLVSTSSAFAATGPQPDKVVNGVKVYSLSHLRTVSGIRQVTVTKNFKVQVKSAKTSLKGVASFTPLTYYIYVRAVITWIYWYGNFLCGYGTGSAWTNPVWSTVDEQGDLYINGNWKDGTVSSDVGSTTASTACYNTASGSFWEMYVSGADLALDGSTGFAETTAFGFQP